MPDSKALPLPLPPPKALKVQGDVWIPRDYQTAISNRMAGSGHKSSLFVIAKPGAGKTASTLDGILRLKKMFWCKKTLIIGPPRVASYAWTNERKKWANFHGLSMAVCNGSPDKRKRILQQNHDIVTISCDLVTWLVEHYFGHKEKKKKLDVDYGFFQFYAYTFLPRADLSEYRLTLGMFEIMDDEGFEECSVGFKNRVYLVFVFLYIYKLWSKGNEYRIQEKPPNAEPWPFDNLVIDESTKFKNSKDCQRFNSIKPILPLFTKRTLLTGTPCPNGIEELWAQLYLLDGGQRLGRTFKDFANQYLYKLENGFDWKGREGAKEAIYRKIHDITIVVEGYSDLPEVVEVTELINMTDAAQKAYKRLKKHFIMEVLGDDALVSLDGNNVLVSANNAAILAGKLLQISGGSVYSDIDLKSKSKEVVPVHTAKMDALKDLLEQVPDETVLIVYNYQHELDRLLKEIPGAVKLGSNASLDAWNRKEIKAGIAHAASLGHGLNLQDGGRRIIWFGPCHSNELKEQFDARLARSGQKQTVFIHTLACKGTIDEAIIEKLHNRQSLQNYMINLLKQHRKEVNHGN